MKKAAFLAWMIFLCFMIPAAPAAGRQTLTVSTGEWAPWTGENLKHNGFVCHVVKQVFDRAGYDVSFKFYPWKRAYILLKNGAVHASAYWYESLKRKRHCYYSGSLTRERIVFFHLKTKPVGRWENLSDLKEYRIGASRGNTYTDEFWELAEKGTLNVDVADNDLLNFKKLIRERIDIFPSSQIMGTKLLRENFSPEAASILDYSRKPLTVTTGHLLFPKVRDDSAELLEVFNEELEAFKKEGLYDRYMDDLIQGGYSNKNISEIR